MRRLLLLFCIAICIGCGEEPRKQAQPILAPDPPQQEKVIQPPHGPIYPPVEEVDNKDRSLSDEPIDEATATLLTMERPEGSPEFADLFTHPNHMVRKRAIERLLARSSISRSSFTEQLIHALSDPDFEIRRGAANLLTPTPEAITSLAKTIEDPDSDVSFAAAESLKKAGPAAQSIVPILIEIIRSPHSRERSLAIYTLGFIGGEEAKSIGPELKKFLDEDKDLDGPSARALVQLGEIDLLIAKVRADAQRGECPFGFALELVKPTTEEIQTVLIEACQKCDGIDRVYAFRALHGAHPTTQRVVTFLEQSLEDPNSSVREEAAEALRWVNPFFESSLPALVKALNDPDEEVRKNAADALGRFKTNDKSQTLAFIEMALQPQAIRQAAINSLKESAWPTLISYVEDKQHDEQRRAAALRLLRPRFLKASKETLALAKQILEDAQEQPSVRAMAASIFVADKVPHDQLIPALIVGVREGVYDEVRELSARDLGTLKAAEGIDVLVGALNHKNKDVICAATKSLGEIGEPVPAAIPRLQELAMDKEGGTYGGRYTRNAALLTLGAIDPTGKQSLAIILAAMNFNQSDSNSDAVVEIDAIRAMTQMAIKSDVQREAAVSALVSRLKEEGRDARWEVAENFALLATETEFFAADPPSPSALAATDALAEALENSDPQLRLLAAKALANQGPAASSAAASLVKALLAESKGNNSHRHAYLEALGETRGSPELAIPVLVDYLDLPGHDKHAMRTLEHYGVEAAPAIPKLIKLLGNDDHYIRYLSARVLGSIGPSAKEAIEPLEKLSVDTKSQEYTSVIEALKKIKSPE